MKEDKQIEEIGRRFCASYISVSMGMSYQTAMKHIQDKEVGEPWIFLAKQARELATQKLEAYANLITRPELATRQAEIDGQAESEAT